MLPGESFPGQYGVVRLLNGLCSRVHWQRPTPQRQPAWWGKRRHDERYGPAWHLAWSVALLWLLDLILFVRVAVIVLRGP